MTKSSLALTVAAAIALLVAIAGCGGSSGYSSTASVTTPPTSLALQPNSAVNPSPGVFNGLIAVKGSVIFVGTDQNLFNVIWVGGHKYYFFTDISQASLLSANNLYATGACAEGSIIWPYRTNSAPIEILGDSITSVAKNSNMFFDVTFNSSNGTEAANLLTLKGNKVLRVPYNLPVVDFTQNAISGLAVNDSGLALLDVFADDSFFGLSSPARLKAIRNSIKARGMAITGTPRERLTKMKLRARPSTTTLNPSGYYLVSTKGMPIALALPPGAFSIVVNSVNNNGISVGGAYVGDPNNPNIIPYYWDAQGNPYPLAIPVDVNFGYCQDINDEGAIVGLLGNDITEYGAIWNTSSSNPLNVNSLLSPTFPYTLYYIDSIGNDFSMATEGYTQANVDLTIFLGIQPN